MSLNVLIGLVLYNYYNFVVKFAVLQRCKARYLLSCGYLLASCQVLLINYKLSMRSIGATVLSTTQIPLCPCHLFLWKFRYLFNIIHFENL